MNELKTTQEIVKKILEQFPLTRNSDNLLYIKVCEYANKDVLNKPFWQVMSMANEYGIPHFETVRRTRQKLQATHPELAGSEEVEGHRMLKEETFREYARGYV